MTPERLREIERLLAVMGKDALLLDACNELLAKVRSLTPTWTHEAPTVKGWYFYRSPDNDDGEEICGAVIGPDGLEVWIGDECYYGDSLTALPGRWSDKPIAMPVEPEGGR